MSWLAAPAMSVLRAYSRIAPTERGGYRLVRATRRLIPASDWNRQWTTPDRLKLSLDLAVYPDCCMAVGLYELDTDRTLRRHLRPGSWFVDCGANIGYFTLLAATLVGPAGRVDAFEPDPLNRQRLESHVAANSLSARVRVHCQALGDHAGQIDLFHPPASSGNHGMSTSFPTPAGQAAAQRFTAPLARLDEILSTTSRHDGDSNAAPDLMKLDIEGAELFALRGATRLLSSPRPPTLVVEHNPPVYSSAGYRPSDLFELLTKVQPRYRIYQIGWRLRHIPTAAALDAITRQCNLLVTTR